jgi:hypothetical protein
LNALHGENLGKNLRSKGLVVFKEKINVKLNSRQPFLKNVKSLRPGKPQQNYPSDLIAALLFYE